MASLTSKFRLVRSPLGWVGLCTVLGLVGLTGCGGRSLDLKTTEKNLKEELVKQGVGSLKEVSCPQEMKAGKMFDCTGIFESGIGFKIPVEHKSEGDKLVWEIPTIKGMLNMNQVMKTIQGELKVSAGSLDCGTSSTYRMATLGSSFECTVVLDKLDAKPEAKSEANLEVKPEVKKTDLPAAKGSAKVTKEPDKVEIAIASSGDVTWQRLIAAAPGKTDPLAVGAKPTIDPSAAKVDDKSPSKEGKDLKEKVSDTTSENAPDNTSPAKSTPVKPVIDANYDS